MFIYFFPKYITQGGKFHTNWGFSPLKTSQLSVSGTSTRTKTQVKLETEYMFYFFTKYINLSDLDVSWKRNTSTRTKSDEEPSCFIFFSKCKSLTLGLHSCPISAEVDVSWKQNTCFIFFPKYINLSYLDFTAVSSPRRWT